MPMITAENRKWWVVVAMSGVMIILAVDFFGLALSGSLFNSLENRRLLSWGRRKPALSGEHPKTAHPLWGSLWRRRHHRAPAGSTPAG